TRRGVAEGREPGGLSSDRTGSMREESCRRDPWLQAGCDVPPLCSRMSSRILARTVAAEVTRRKCFLSQNPPPYLGGYAATTSPAFCCALRFELCENHLRRRRFLIPTAGRFGGY